MLPPLPSTLAAGLLDPLQITLLFIAFGLLLGLARLLGEVARYWGQPAILGEIMAGVILGPTLLGAVAPDLFHTLFDPYEAAYVQVADGRVLEYVNADGEAITTGGIEGDLVYADGYDSDDKVKRPAILALEGLFVISAALLLLIAGLEVELSTVWRQGKAALYVSAGSMLIPFVLGVPLAYFAPGLLAMDADFLTAGPLGDITLPFVLFMGIALSITALPVIAKVLMDLNLAKTDFGTIVISSAMLNDLVGWVGFAMVLALLGSGAAEVSGVAEAAAGGAVGDVLVTVGLTLAFIGLMLTAGTWLLNRVLPWVQAHASWPGGPLALVLVLAMFGAAFTEWIGIHSIFGAFIVGIAVGNNRHLREHTRHTIHDFIANVFAPLFFAGIGLRVDFVASFDIVSVVVVLVVAVIGKVAGSVLFAKLAGIDRREAWAIGYAMCARGAMEVILAQLALEAGLINDELFVAIVVMAIVTSLISGPAIEWILKPQQPIRLRDLLSERGYVARLDASTREQAIHQLSVRASELGGMALETIESAVWERERVFSTGLGQGVALPHGRVAGLSKPVVVLGRDFEGIDFNAPDGKPAQVICMVVSPLEAADEHVMMLAAVTRTLSVATVRERVLEAANFTELLAAVSAQAEAG